jgi:hypothetical protein
MCVAAGIGITPFLGILHHFVFRQAAAKIENQRNALLYDRRHYMRQRRWHKDAQPKNSAAASQRSSGGGARRRTASESSEGAAKHPCVAGGGDDRCTIIWTVRDLTLVDFLLPYVADLLALQTGAEPLVTVKIFFTGQAVSMMESLVTNVLLLHHFGRYENDGGHALQVVLGRPDMKEEVCTIHPSAVFYCGGTGLLRRLKQVCSDPEVNVPVFEEEFQNQTLATWPALFGHKNKVGGD